MTQALPKAVQAQLDAAEAIEQQLAGGVETQTEPTVEPTESVAPPVVTPAPEAKQDIELEQKFKTLDGKYKAEIPRLHSQIVELNQMLEQAKAQLAKAPEARSDVKPTPTVTEKDVEAFGTDLIDLAQRVALSAVRQELTAFEDRLKGQLAPVQQTVSDLVTTQASTAEQRFFDDLAKQVPDWESINQDDRWLGWLTGRSPGSLHSRQEILNVARAGLNLPVVSEIFQTFKDEHQPAPAAAPKPPASQALQSQVAPGRSRSASAPAEQGNKKIWSSDDIVKALDPRKLRQMSTEEAASVIAEIDAASAEGRVRA